MQDTRNAPKVGASGTPSGSARCSGVRAAHPKSPACDAGQQTPARGAGVESRLQEVGISADVLPYINPRTGTLRHGVAVPKAIRDKYFAYMQAGKAVDELSNNQLRKTWRARFSVAVAIELGYPESQARAVYFDDVLRSRQVTGVREYRVLKDKVDGEVDKRLMAVRGEGRDPFEWLAEKYANIGERARLYARRMEREEEREFLLAGMAEAANESLPFFEQATEAEREWEKKERAARRGEEDVWLLSTDLAPLPPLPIPSAVERGSGARLGEVAAFAAPLLPRVSPPEPAAQETPRALDVNPGVAVEQLIAGAVKSRPGLKKRLKARGEHVAPNPGVNQRKKAKVRAERAVEALKATMGALKDAGADSPEISGTVGREGVSREPMAMLAPNVAPVEVSVEARTAEAAFESPDEGDSTPVSGETPETTALTRRAPSPGIRRRCVALARKSAVGSCDSGGRHQQSCAYVAPTPLPLEPPRPHWAFEAVEAAMIWWWRKAVWLGVTFAVGWMFVWQCVSAGAALLIGWIAGMCVMQAAVGPCARFFRWMFAWPSRPVTPEEFAGDKAFTMAVRVGGQGLHRDEPDHAKFAESLIRTGVNTQARNPETDASRAFIVGVEGHTHAGTLREYGLAYASRLTMKSRMLRTFRRVLIVCFVLAFVPPLFWVVRADDGSETAPFLDVGDLARYVGVLTSALAFARVCAWWDETPRAKLVEAAFPVNEAGLLLPEAFDVESLRPGAYVLNSTSTVTTCLGFGDGGKLGAHCKVDCKTTQECLSPESRGATLLGWTTSPAFVLRKCLCNAHNALCHRHGTKQPPVKRDVNEVLPQFHAAVSRGSDRYWLNEMMTFAVWLAKWPFGKQESIKSSMAREVEAPGKVKAMVKREVNHKAPSKARLIQFYWNLISQALFGPQFYSAQKTLCEIFRAKHMDGGIDVTFASGMKPDEIGRWMEGVNRDGAVCFYERDGKNWDSSMQKQHAEFRQSIYRLYDNELAEFAGKCDTVKGFALFPGGTLRYSMAYTVKSGHNDTTLGNSLVNAAIAYAALRRLGLRGSILVAGDDLLVALYETVDVATIASLEAEYGITPEARVFDDFERVTFTSGMFLSDGEMIGFVPLPGRLFARLWWTVKPPSARRRGPYLRGVARGLLPVAGEIPLLRVLLKSFDTQGSQVASDKGRQFRGASFSFGPGIWLAMERRYGLTVESIVECEEWLRSLPAGPLLLKHHVLDRLMEVDLADIGERGSNCW
jgi:hypothetical protein